MNDPKPLTVTMDSLLAAMDGALEEAHQRASRPRVLARITEEYPDDIYRARCESCSFTAEYTSLALTAERARNHAVCTGHAVLVEAL